MPWGTSSGNSSSVPPPPLIRLLLHRFFDHRLFYGYPSKDSPVENSSENRGSTGLQGDLVAQSLDAAGGPPDCGLAVPFIKVVTAQISIGSAVSQQMIDNHQNTVGQCQDGSLGASSCCQSVVLGRQVALFGTGCAPGCFYQGRTQPGVTMSSVPILAFASALIIPRADLGPGSKGARGGKAAHISTQFGQNLFSSPQPDARDGVGCLDRCFKRAPALLHLLVQLGNLLGQKVQVPQLALQQHTLVRSHHPFQGLRQFQTLVAQASFSQRRQMLGVVITLSQSLQHFSSRCPSDVGSHAAQLDVGSLQDLLNPVHHLGPLANQVSAVAHGAVRDAAGQQSILHP